MSSGQLAYSPPWIRGTFLLGGEGSVQSRFESTCNSPHWRSGFFFKFFYVHYWKVAPLPKPSHGLGIMHGQKCRSVITQVWSLLCFMAFYSYVILCHISCRVQSHWIQSGNSANERLSNYHNKMTRKCWKPPPIIIPVHYPSEPLADPLADHSIAMAMQWIK